MIGGPVPPCTPPSGFFFVPQASTLLCRMAFLISTCYLFYFPSHQGGVPNLHQVALRPLDAPYRRNVFTQSEYFTISNCFFLISTFQLQQFPRFQGDPKFTLGGPMPLCTPHSVNIFVPEASTLLCLMAFSISTFQLLYFPRYSGGPVAVRSYK